MANEKKKKTSERVLADIEARDELVALLASVREPDAMRRLFDELFTRAELHDLVLRWRLLKMLVAGVPQREIASVLGVSLCKITRGSRVLKTNASVVADLLKKTPARKGS